MTRDEEIDERIEALEKGISLANAQAEEKIKGAEKMQRALAKLVKEKQRRCKHPKGYHGFILGVCPDCGDDDGGY